MSILHPFFGTIIRAKIHIMLKYYQQSWRQEILNYMPKNGFGSWGVVIQSTTPMLSLYDPLANFFRNQIPNARLFAVMTIFKIEKVLRDFVLNSTNPLRFLAFYM